MHHRGIIYVTHANALRVRVPTQNVHPRIYRGVFRSPFQFRVIERNFTN